MEERLFTLSEANRLVPELEEILARIQPERRLLVKVAPEIEKAVGQAEWGGGSPAGPAYVQAMERILHGVKAVQETGVLLKDLDKGLCDFPYLLNGRVVYLCWQLGEPDIRWWHEVHTGFAWRQPLDMEGYPDDA